jgi:hypothetical protein
VTDPTVDAMPGGVVCSGATKAQLKLKFRPAGFDRRMVAELWHYPDGSRILELSTKCTPAEAFDVAAATKSFLSDRGIDLSAPQQTKTRTALEFFAKELADERGDE